MRRSLAERITIGLRAITSFSLWRCSEALATVPFFYGPFGSFDGKGISAMRYAALSTWFCLCFAIGPMIATAVDAPWAALIPFKKSLSTDPKTFALTAEQGPWLILAASFSGDKAETHAMALITELRGKYKLPAYWHKQTYDFSQPTEGTMINQRGEKAKMRFVHSDKYDALAVLVGDFRSVDDSSLDKTLDKIKYLKPDCLDLTKNKESSQSFAGIKEIFRKVSTDPARSKKGPMGSAFATRNPLLPDEYFTASGVDDFVAKLNRGVKYSLLENPGKFTVRVASFRGATSINQREIEELQRSGKVTDKLAVAADKAHRLTTALRKQGVEAYEFHDRTESVVTIGHFESEGTPLPNGAIEINPDMYRIVRQYQAGQTPIPGRRMIGMQPKVLDGVSFDVQPVPMAVPRRSIAADYARRK